MLSIRDKTVFVVFAATLCAAHTYITTTKIHSVCSFLVIGLWYVICVIYYIPCGWNAKWKTFVLANIEINKSHVQYLGKCMLIWIYMDLLYVYKLDWTHHWLFVCHSSMALTWKLINATLLRLNDYRQTSNEVYVSVRMKSSKKIK